MENQKEIQAAKHALNETERRLKRAGLSRPYYLKKIKEFCEATKAISCISGKDAGSGSVDFVDVPDYQTQVQGVKMIIDLYGDKAPVKSDVSGEIKTVSGLTPELQEMFTAIFGGAK